MTSQIERDESGTMTLAGESPSPAGVKGTAIVVTYNSARCVASCLSALASQTGWEVILIDNASKDDTAKRDTQFATRVRAGQTIRNTIGHALERDTCRRPNDAEQGA
ncbi:glycosyltransferase [Lacticaseibacillus rhamnosus]